MTLVLPRLGRAGLGNELFPALRAAEVAAETSGTLIAPRWFQLRVGPTLRGERDRRQYWRLFRPPTLEQRILRRRAESVVRAGRGDDASEVVLVAGMRDYYEPFVRPGQWHRETLLGWARDGVVGPARRDPYLGVHVRLGDFKRPDEGASSVSANNTSTPLGWYVGAVRALRAGGVDLPVVVASDGEDSELADLLRMPGVARSGARNALDEIVLLSRSAGILGSRSTFTSWGAFLGSVPLLVAPGGNAYRPHEHVWESRAEDVPDGWLDLLARSWA
ncbi:hypothetical protein [Cellulosimicrobium cellulans]|uniref:Glycosyl transferase family 11 n=1 Tax=Cellulosimicrobium cellulans TaxID=1710 RepID=A0A4Y4DYZ2_CELCE|nr:hypothetical protein [Cellulosimicrobium cellulans]GED08588.1 hypothetical protein CCE02nite_05870 [Cellulosimicrobium cellulans]